MSDNITEAISKVQLPTPSELKDKTDEEEIYVETPDEIQDEHKNANVLKEVQEKAREAVNTLKIENQNLQKLADHRIRYSWAILAFVVVFCLLVLRVVFLVGSEEMKLSDTVLNMLLGTTMVQVIGVLYIVAKWLYPQNGKDKTK